MPIAILMPVYNEGERLDRTLAALRAHATEAGGITVFLVDDGSDGAFSLPASTELFRVVVARHAVNLGQGAAIETARQLALRDAKSAASPASGYGAYVTMDADGQHDVRDALAVARAISDGADVVFGDRFGGMSNVPRGRRALLHAARIVEWALTGLRLSDAHNGLRGFSRRALERIEIRQNRMAHATEIKQRVSRDGSLRIVELPVSVKYSADTLAKGQRSLGAAEILRDLALQYFFGEVE